ncbi:hypothetical protein IF650_04165 [Cellulosimicrobium terreum]|nr:hypothetical protein [Cellulosimicrobium terreum]
MTTAPPASLPDSLPTLTRALALGVAAGCRGSLGVAAPVLASPVGPAPVVGQVVAALAVVGELVGDKLPRTPSRLDPPGPLVRASSGAVGGALLARRGNDAAAAVLVGAAVAGAVGSAAGTWGGAAWRRLAADRWPDWPFAAVEDVVALALAAWATRP